MKKIIQTLFLLITSLNIFCQNQIIIGKSCSYYGEKMPTQAYTFSSDNESKATLKLITEASGLSANFTIVAGNVPNACATMIYNSQTKELERYIIYNQTFMHNISNKINYWASISILAHEVGHHLNGHSLQLGGSRPSLELEADKFSGFILAKLGATLEDAQSAINSLVSEEGSVTHPPKSARLAAIANGWYQNSNAINQPNSNQSSNNNLAPKPKALFYGKENEREQVFIKKTSPNDFILLSENGYKFSSYDFKKIDINENLKIFWFPDYESYGYLNYFLDIPLNETTQLEKGNAPIHLVSKTEIQTVPGNYLTIYYPSNSFEIISNGIRISNPKYIKENDEYYFYEINNGIEYINIMLEKKYFTKAESSQKIIVKMGMIEGVFKLDIRF